MDVGVEEGWRDERRLRLLEAAARVFSRLTYERASMDEIAHEAGVGKPTLYRYFPSKDALFAAVFEQALDDLEARFEAVLDRETNVAARLSGLVTAMVPIFRAHLVALRFLGEDAAVVDQSQRRIFRERRVRIADHLAEAVSGAADTASVRAGLDPGRIAHLVIGMVWSGTSSTPAQDDEIARDVADLVLHGICSPSGSRGAARGRGAAPERSPAGAMAAGRLREAVE